MAADLIQEVERKNKRIIEIQKIDGNSICADCPAEKPLWVSFLKDSEDVKGTKLSIEGALCVIVCDTCATHHHFEMGPELCSLKYLKYAHEWTDEELDCVEDSGNRMVNDAFEAGNKKFDKMEINYVKDEEDERRGKFIKSKYVKKKFVDNEKLERTLDRMFGRGGYEEEKKTKDRVRRESRIHLYKDDHHHRSSRDRSNSRDRKSSSRRDDDKKRSSRDRDYDRKSSRDIYGKGYDRKSSRFKDSKDYDRKSSRFNDSKDDGKRSSSRDDDDRKRSSRDKDDKKSEDGDERKRSSSRDDDDRKRSSSRDDDDRKRSSSRDDDDRKKSSSGSGRDGDRKKSSARSKSPSREKSSTRSRSPSRQKSFSRRRGDDKFRSSDKENEDVANEGFSCLTSRVRYGTKAPDSNRRLTQLLDAKKLEKLQKQMVKASAEMDDSLLDDSSKLDASSKLDSPDSPKPTQSALTSGIGKLANSPHRRTQSSEVDAKKLDQLTRRMAKAKTSNNADLSAVSDHPRSKAKESQSFDLSAASDHPRRRAKESNSFDLSATSDHPRRRAHKESNTSSPSAAKSENRKPLTSREHSKKRLLHKKMAAMKASQAD